MMDKKIADSSSIQLRIGLNAAKQPAKIEWQADGHTGGNGFDECKAMLLSLFDKKSKETLKIDLWTIDMEVGEMDRFIFQSLRAIADTYYHATQNKELAADMQRFVHYFGEQTQLIPRSEDN